MTTSRPWKRNRLIGTGKRKLGGVETYQARDDGIMLRRGMTKSALQFAA
jgi:hypothetical protein